MRVSCDVSDTGYQEWSNLRAQGKDVKIFLNGVEMDSVILADDQKDEIVCHALPLRVDPDTGDLVLETYYGRVSIEVCDPEPVPDTLQVSLVEHQDDPGDCDTLPSDVFCFKGQTFYIDDHSISFDALGNFVLPPLPKFEVELDCDFAVDDFGHVYFEEPDDFVIFDEFSDIEDSLSRMLSERL